MAIEVNPAVSPRIITVPEADGDSITIQLLVNQIRSWEDNQPNLSYSKLLSAGGKEVLGGGVLVGITATLENAKVKFAARTSPTICTILGGNLVALDANGDPMSPIQYTENVLVALSQSSSATLMSTGVSGLTSEESTKLMTITDIGAVGHAVTSTPTETSSLEEKLNWLVQYFKCKREITQTEEKLFASDGETVIGTVSITKDATTFTKGEMV